MSAGSRKLRAAAVAAAVTCLLLAPAGLERAALAADPFYSGLLSSGARAYARGDYETAARHLRIACFGLLEEPEVLVEGLVRLALAQAQSAGRSEFDQTYQRLLQVEDRFGLYGRVPLPVEIRAAFESQLARLIPDNELLKAGEPPGPGDAEALDEATAAPAPTTPTIEDRARFDQIRRLAASAATVDNLQLAIDMAADLSARNPEWRGAHLLAAEVNYLAGRWADAVELYRRADEPAEEETSHLFYYAVALYESGEVERARAALERALPALERTPFVESYVERVFGVP